VKAGINVLLEGEAGTGKTTIAKQLAADLKIPFSSLSMTKQTSMNAIIGFISINGKYIPSQFRKAFEEGHLFLLDEIDAADPNVLLILNTIENGYIAFPDGIVEAHKDFRLVATSNPQGAHQMYTGRSKLDFSTLDRYFTVELPRDPKLELNLTSQKVVDVVEFGRQLLKDQGSSIQITMRDAMRIHELTVNEIDEDPIQSVVFAKDSTLLKIYHQKVEQFKAEAAEAKKTQHDTDTIEELWQKIQEGK